MNSMSRAISSPVTQPQSRLPGYIPLVKSSRKSVQAVLPGPGIITQLVKEE